MKRHGNLFEKIVSYENLMLAHKNARKGKAHYTEVKMVNENPDHYIRLIQEALLNKTFTTSKYTIFEKFDGRKMRTLYKLPYFPDRIIQHAIVQICGPIWKRTLIRDTYQSIPRRGTHNARKRVEKVIRNHPTPLYALKFDIEKYYPNVDNTLLKREIRRKIKCKDTLWLLDNIIDSNGAKGIPIGNYTSQFFGNIYLSTFDWWIKQTLKPVAYFRYCDDIVLLHTDSHTLHEMRKQCFDKLNNHYQLSIKRNHQVFAVEKQGLDFVGFVFRSKSIRLRKTIVRKMKTLFDKIETTPQTLTPHQIVGATSSYWGWCKYANAKKLWFGQLSGHIQNHINTARRVILSGEPNGNQATF